MLHISRSTKAASAIAALALTVLAGTGVAMAAVPGTATASTTIARSTSTQPIPSMKPAAVVDAPTKGDVRDVAKADAETADGAKETDKVQQGNQAGPDNVRDAETADRAKDIDKVPQGDRMSLTTAKEAPATSAR